jgi:hypothetical protein
MKLAALILLALLAGCATVDRLTLPPAPVMDEHGVVDDGFPEGAVTTPPWGYSKHCYDYPDSVFCK